MHASVGFQAEQQGVFTVAGQQLHTVIRPYLTAMSDNVLNASLWPEC